VETPTAWVFLTDTRAYKLKKPIRLDGLDLTTAAARRRHAVLEVQLNRPLAGSVYEGVVRLAHQGATFALEGPEHTADWLVKMERLPADRMLGTMLRTRRLRPSHLHATATQLARFHQSLPPALSDPDAYRRGLLDTVQQNARALRHAPRGLSPAAIATTADALRTYIHRAHAALDARVLDGRIVEGHGDLRPCHVCLQARPVLFGRAAAPCHQRVLDAADDLAFLGLECAARGETSATTVLLEAYRRSAQDTVSTDLVVFYQAYRALQRAGAAAQEARARPASATVHSHRAERYLQQAEGRARLCSRRPPSVRWRAAVAFDTWRVPVPRMKAFCSVHEGVLQGPTPPRGASR
jgi:aminoglycoside phosphotransferase family enzyme